ncbi:PAS/PAC sensor signal transduction histidine kinase [Fibrella aestuarina BUZ 2]|uniref:histidine kinase n=1 Tax=Fibrella aestuarina BUZ 2 TaxID=1166018 RepID=I0KCK7_9BACT|nr:ATP-binding protein [Fibrella aestuarina]CCH01860.1 PAS/PAC sensor signal transduction histidine kinase [Fibrella aestuarina BUZ 2]
MNTSATSSLALEVERLQLALQAAQVGTWDYNLETKQAEWSVICKQLFGLPAESDVSAAALLEQVHPDDRERVRLANARSLSPESDGEHNLIFRTHIAADDYRWVQAKGRTLRNQQGQLSRFSGIVFDITELKQMQEALRQNTNELEHRVAERTQDLYEANQQLKKSNEHLAEFAYIASHDLQEPLRKIQSFSNLLLERHDVAVNDNDYLQRIHTAASRMATLLHDLLAYSRLSTRSEGTQPLQLTDLFEAVLQDQELLIEETGAVIDLHPLPAVMGRPAQLTQLFNNLVNNALKFRREGVVPQLTVQAIQLTADELPERVKPSRLADSYYRIDLSDNGIGFDEKYVDRIFQVFQRLHGRSAFPGTGIGLAICEKVAINHGGGITAQSQAGVGTTFSLYLPV